MGKVDLATHDVEDEVHVVTKMTSTYPSICDMAFEQQHLKFYHIECELVCAWNLSSELCKFIIQCGYKFQGSRILY